MVSKKLLSSSSKYGITILIGIVILAVLFYIVKQPGAGLFTRGVASVSQWMEGFTSSAAGGTFSTSDNSCPPGFTFFNDATGTSFCCRGTVDVFSHKCMANGATDLCAMMPNVADPRKAHKGKKLPTCSSLKRKMLSAANANFCPSSLPNYASSNKCCKKATNPAGTDCSPADLADKGNYCVAGGAATAGEQSCYNLKLNDMATCPTGMGKFGIPAQSPGTNWAQRYGTSNISDVTIPGCMSIAMGGACIPNNVIEKLRVDKNMFRDKNLETWKFACGPFKRKYIDGDSTLVLDEAL